MPAIWPFAAIADTTESLEWRTEIHSAKSKEQRVATRITPRRGIALNHVMTLPEYTAARAMIRANESFYVPYWPQAIRVGSIAAGSNVVVSFATANLDFTSPGNAILWESSSKYEYVTLNALTANNVTIATIVNSYTNAMIIPTFEAFTREGLSIDRTSAKSLTASISFAGFVDSDISATSFAQYRGNDLMSTGFAVDAGGSLTDAIVWPISEIDNEIGRPVPIRSRSIPDEAFTARWHVFSRADTYTLRRWIYSRYGRQRAFWASSRMRDFVPAATISAIGTVLTIFAPVGVTSLGRTSFDIEVRTVGGTLYQRQVTNVAAGSPVNGLPTLNLTISSAFGVQLTVADFDRISYLRCLRFNADRIELLHRRDRGLAVAVQCMEIDNPVDTDPYFSNVVLLCHFDGTNGQTTTIDSSSKNQTTNIFGSSLTDAQFKYGTASYNGKDGSGTARVQVPISADFAFGQLFTIETYAYFTSVTSNIHALIDSWGGGGQRSWYLGYDGNITFFYSTDGTNSFSVTGAWTPTLNTQYHIAVDRDASNVIRVYVDGVVKASAAVSATFFTPNYDVWIGNSVISSFGSFTGYIDELRVTKGVCRYGGAFIPPTSAFPNS